MKEYTTQQLRNIALIGHGSSGKTTLTETLLFLSGATSRRGKVEDGTTVMDFDEEEIRRHISISTGLAPVEWKGAKLNLLDTPGYMDYVAEVKGALRVTDLAMLVLDAAAGVEVGTELTWGYAQEEELPCLVLVNKMDRENANFERALQSLAEAFAGVRFLPIVLPIGAQADFQGVVDLLEKKAYLGPKGDPAAVPAALADSVEERYTQMVEAAAEGDDELLMKYLEGEELTPEEIVSGLRKAILNRTVVPVIAVSGNTTVGALHLLDLLVTLAPNPAERGPVKAESAQGEEELEVSDLSPLALLVFKTAADPYVGKLTYFRVCSGAAVSGSTSIFNSRAEQDERLGQVYVMRGKEQITVESLHAGDIGAVAKLNVTRTGDTLCARDHRVTLRGPSFPKPIFSVAVSPKTKADSAKLMPTLARICEEDPTLHAFQDPTTHETILAGMGDAHVDTVVRRMQGRFGVGVEVTTPRIPYRETITTTSTAQYRHKKQTGGAGQFAEVHMRVEPLERDAGFEYIWEVFGGRISSSFMPSIEKGIKSVLETGVMAGYPVVDVRVAITDGKEHPVDSKDIAFQIAGREGFKQAFMGGKPVLLEPIYRVTILVPDDFTGAVMSDLNTRRARVEGIDQQGRKSVITATAPLAEMQQYAINLRAITQGRGVFSMELSHYDQVPGNLAQQLVEQAKASREQEAE